MSDAARRKRKSEKAPPTCKDHRLPSCPEKTRRCAAISSNIPENQAEKIIKGKVGRAMCKNNMLLKPIRIKRQTLKSYIKMSAQELNIAGKCRCKYQLEVLKATIHFTPRPTTCGEMSGSSQAIRSIFSGTPSWAISDASSPPLRTKFPMAPAAFARVFSSGSSTAMHSGVMLLPRTV